MTVQNNAKALDLFAVCFREGHDKYEQILCLWLFESRINIFIVSVQLQEVSIYPAVHFLSATY